jgi:hypothetical protein
MSAIIEITDKTLLIAYVIISLDLSQTPLKKLILKSLTVFATQTDILPGNLNM